MDELGAYKYTFPALLQAARWQGYHVEQGEGKEKRKENVCEPLHSLDKLTMDKEICSVGEAICWHVRLSEVHHNSLPTQNYND